MPTVDVSIDVEIKSCPFCGTQPIARSDVGPQSQNYWVKCPTSNCSASTLSANTATEAIARWNRRA